MISTMQTVTLLVWIFCQTSGYLQIPQHILYQYNNGFLSWTQQYSNQDAHSQ